MIWEFGLPDVESIHLRALLQFYNRSFTHHASDPTSLPAMCARDVESMIALDYAPRVDTIPWMVWQMRKYFPVQLAFPLSKESMDSFVQWRETERWIDTSTVIYRELKPSPATESYLSSDNMPGAVIRARVRMGIARTPQRMWQSRLVQSPKCPKCRVLGDIPHILLECKAFRKQRARCKSALSSLFFGVSNDGSAAASAAARWWVLL